MSTTAATPSAPQPRPAAGLAAEIITTGTEILLGDIVDTNAAWIAQQLRDAGVNLYYKTTVGDNEARLRGVLTLAMSRSDVAIVSGGLGPTADDITRQAIAAATDCPLQLHEGALATLQARFARFGVPMTDNNRQQALIPAGATLIPNPVGTAPGFIVQSGRCAIIAVPGVPREMKHLMTETVLPYLRHRSGDTGVIRRRVLRTVGIGESAIDSRIHDLMLGANPTVALAAHTGQADVRIAARAATVTEADALLDAVEGEIRGQIGSHIYSTTPNEPFEVVVVELLRQRHASVALLETNTRGAVAHRLFTAQPEYNPVVGRWIEGVDLLPPALSAELGPVWPLATGQPGDGADNPAVRVASALHNESGATFALVLLGSSGADEGVFGQGQGQTWMALASESGVAGSRASFGGTDETTVVRLGNQALGMLWRHLMA